MVRPVRLRLILNLLLSRFFPASNQTAELLSTAAVFAIGFLMRPLGSLIMGPFADKKGRKAALTPSVTINHGRWLLDHRLCPNLRPSRDHQPPLILVITRMVQGLSLGGEYGTSATYMSEMASRGRWGFYSSFQYVTLIAGQLFSLLVQIILQQVLTDAQLLVIDEPFTGLDPLAVANFIGLIKEAQESGKEILMTTHVLADAQKAIKTYAILNQGTIEFTGSLDEIRDHYGLEASDSFDKLYQLLYQEQKNA